MRMKSVRHRFYEIVMSAMLMVLLVGSVQNPSTARSTPLGDKMMTHHYGAGMFWDDPCTWDGLAFGVGIVGCVAGRAFSCVTAVLAFLKAQKSDGCFD